jgi:hypothetical protein
MNEVVSQLQAEGWLVEKARKAKFQPQDFWGLWDIISVRKVAGSSHCIRFIQVSLKYMSQKVGFEKLAKAFPSIPGSTKEYWHKKGDEFVVKIIK